MPSSVLPIQMHAMMKFFNAVCDLGYISPQTIILLCSGISVLDSFSKTSDFILINWKCGTNKWTNKPIKHTLFCFLLTFSQSRFLKWCKEAEGGRYKAILLKNLFVMSNITFLCHIKWAEGWMDNAQSAGWPPRQTLLITQNHMSLIWIKSEWMQTNPKLNDYLNDRWPLRWSLWTYPEKNTWGQWIWAWWDNDVATAHYTVKHVLKNTTCSPQIHCSQEPVENDFLVLSICKVLLALQSHVCSLFTNGVSKTNIVACFIYLFIYFFLQFV